VFIVTNGLSATSVNLGGVDAALRHLLTITALGTERRTMSLHRGTSIWACSMQDFLFPLLNSFELRIVSFQHLYLVLFALLLHRSYGSAMSLLKCTKVLRHSRPCSSDRTATRVYVLSQKLLFSTATRNGHFLTVHRRRQCIINPLATGVVNARVRCARLRQLR